MKRRLLLGSILAFAAFYAGLHLYLKHQLNMAVEREIVAAARDRLGVEVRVRGTGLSILRGMASLSSVAMANPPGFPEPDIASLDRCTVNVSLLAFLTRRTTVITDARFRNLRVTISRNTAGDVNFDKLVQASNAPRATPTAPAPTAAPENAAPASGGPALPAETIIRRLDMPLHLEYVDHTVAPEPFRLALDFVVEARNVSNFGPTNGPWGDIAIKGSLASDPKAMVTVLSGHIAPLSDSEKPSFDLTGSISAVDPRLFQPLMSGTRFECDPFAISVNLTCRDGVYDATKSSLALNLKNVSIGGKPGRKGKRSVTVDSVSLPVPVGGTVDKPVLQLEQALFPLLLQGLNGGLGALLNPGSRSSEAEGRQDAGEAAAK